MTALAACVFAAAAATCGFAAAELSLAQSPANEVIWIESLDLAAMEQEWGEPHAMQSVDGRPLTVRGVRYAHGVGTHARSEMTIDLGGAVERFAALAAIDDETGGRGTVTFEAWVDGEKRFDSGKLTGRSMPVSAAILVRNAKQLRLVVTDAGDGIDHDHADWLNAALYKMPDAKGKPRAVIAADEPAPEIAAADGPEPRLHGPSIVGASAGKPFLYQVPATGEGPLAFAAEALPDGLAIDAKTGRITGALKSAGITRVTLVARSPRGEDHRELTIDGRGRLALTAPMGWNSWNVWGTSVDDAKVRAAADALVASGLASRGFRFVNIDDAWQGARDANGRIQGNERFPDMRALCDFVHSRGLLIGLYSSPGPKTCAGYEGSLGHEELDAAQYAAWGFDYLKHDWCSGQGDQRAAYVKMRDALAKQPRDIVYSLCQYGGDDVWKWGASVGGNLWRTTGDITDTWRSMSSIGFSQSALAPFAGPGAWNDPDMLVVGRLGWGPSVRPTRLKPNEQITHLTLWSLLAAPLLIGCDLTQLDPFTKALLTNDEVLAVDQDALGKPATRVAAQGDLEVWSRPLADGSTAVGLFNRGRARARVSVRLSDLGVAGKTAARDLWLRRDLGAVEGTLALDVPAHGAALVRLAGAR